LSEKPNVAISGAVIAAAECLGSAFLVEETIQGNFNPEEARLRPI